MKKQNRYRNLFSTIETMQELVPEKGTRLEDAVEWALNNHITLISISKRNYIVETRKECKYAIRQYGNIIYVFTMNDSFTEATVFTPEAAFRANTPYTADLIAQILKSQRLNYFKMDMDGVFKNATIYPAENVIEAIAATIASDKSIVFVS